MKVSCRIDGLQELNSNIQKVIASLSPDEVEPVLLESAEQVADHARANAPEGPTGNLKRSIVAKTLQRRGDAPAPALVAIDFRIAPHAHLVEFGTAERIGPTGKSSGIMPAEPFFRPAWDSEKGHIVEDIRAKLQPKVEGAV